MLGQFDAPITADGALSGETVACREAIPGGDPPDGRSIASAMGADVRHVPTANYRTVWTWLTRASRWASRPHQP
jgi:hypothetical protein